MANHLGRSRPPLTDPELLECWKLYQQHLSRGGTMASAAAEIGISPSAMQQRLILYRDKAGIKVERRVPRNASQDDIKREVAKLEGRIDYYFEILLKKLDKIEEQQRKVIAQPFIPSHRRVADGGQLVNQQLKAYKRKIAS